MNGDGRHVDVAVDVTAGESVTGSQHGHCLQSQQSSVCYTVRYSNIQWCTI